MIKLQFKNWLLATMLLINTAQGEFIDDGDVVRDTYNGLMWQDQANSTAYSGQNAVIYCNNLVYAGYDDWRLPNIYELMTLFDVTQTTEPLSYRVFTNPMLTARYYWSSTNWNTAYAQALTFSTTVNASIGLVARRTSNSTNDAEVYFARCVRAGQP